MNRQFPALRGLAIFLVVVNHSIVLSLLTGSAMQLAKPGAIETFILLGIKEIGVLAVPTFLFLAGGFMVYGLRGKPLIKSIRLILPVLYNAIVPYVVWSIVFFLITFLLKGESYSIPGYIKNLLIGYPFNFVPILVFFIILSPLLVKLCKHYAWAVLAFFLLIQLILINIVLPGIIGFSFPEWMGVFSVPILQLPLALWAIFFPLGIVYGLHSQKINEKLKPFRWVLLSLAIILVIIAILQENEIIFFPIAEWALPMVVILIFPFIKRKKIPFVQFFEELGKRSYGLYLTNLTIITVLTILAGHFLPFLYRIETIFVILLVIITVAIPVYLMQWTERKFGRTIYRMIFG